MPFFGLCRDDELVNTLRELFRANIVRIPEERLQPLRVIGQQGERLSYIGALEPLLKHGNELEQLEPNRSRVADVAGRQSRSVNFNLGLDILQGFLHGFGLPAASIATKFAGATKVSFAFQDVMRLYIDASMIGRALRRAQLDPISPAARAFLPPDPMTMLLIDSVITSKDFTISVTESESEQFDLDVSGIQQIVSGASTGVKVSTSSGRDITFKGNNGLTFAFSCQKIEFLLDGSISRLAPDPNARALSGEEEAASLSPVLIGDEPGMLELE